MKKLLLLAACAAMLAAGCGRNNREKQPADSAVPDSASNTTKLKPDAACPAETNMTPVQTIEVKYEGDCQYCTFAVEGGSPQLLAWGKTHRIKASLGGNDICTLFRVNTGRGLFRGFITINGKTQIVEQEISEMLEQIQRSFSFSDFNLTPPESSTTDPNTTP
ncbi:MAG: hypothetical protein MUC87_16095 [Bacteroidia bacterium]|jgi:hypothetical protein|nr:hypothetical protein [Bacteroidia bacterium]